MFGVSPAFFISLYGQGFTVPQISEGLKLLKDMDFESWQLEIFFAERLSEWENGGASLLKETSDKLSMIPTQFVGHFLLHAFENRESLESSYGKEEIERVAEFLKPFNEVKVITIPLPEFSSSESISIDDYHKLYDIFQEKLLYMVKTAEDRGFRCALEIMPGSIIDGTEGFLRLTEKKGFENIGVNLDTGHFNASRENMSLLIGKLADRITGTHICDNDGITNNSNAPGNGNVPWKQIINSLKKSGFEGPWDLEIICKPEEVRKVYTYGRDYLKDIRL